MGLKTSEVNPDIGIPESRDSSTIFINSRISGIFNICVIVENLRIFDITYFIKYAIKTVRPSSIEPE